GLLGRAGEGAGVERWSGERRAQNRDVVLRFTLSALRLSGWAVDVHVRHPPVRGEVGWLPRPAKLRIADCRLQMAASQSAICNLQSTIHKGAQREQLHGRGADRPLEAGGADGRADDRADPAGVEGAGTAAA